VEDAPAEPMPFNRDPEDVNMLLGLHFPGTVLGLQETNHRPIGGDSLRKIP